MISVQTQDFDIGEEYRKLQVPSKTGAVVSFVGCVRDFGEGDFILQHYPGMTEKVLRNVEAQANEHWPLLASTIIHRVGKLGCDDQIVYVGVSSAHREAAFEACHYMIDILKTQAPFWKKEGDHWVESKTSDQHAADSWLTS